MGPTLNEGTSTALFAGSLVVALALSHRPVGDWIHRSVTSTAHGRAERLVYRAVGADPDGEQTWGAYARSVLAFSAVGVVGLYALLRLQPHLPGDLGVPAMPADQAWNTAVSFVTNTNWQSYSGETGAGNLAQAGGLAVQNFLSAAVGVCVALALVRGFARQGTDLVGSFWVDLVRVTFRVLLPGAAVAAVLLVAGGAVQNLGGGHDVTTLAGVAQHVPGGPVASQEAIKQLGTNGGGFFNANSAHPFENPTGWTNWLQVYLLLVIPFALPRTFGRMIGRPRQGTTIALVMAAIASVSVALMAWVQLSHPGTVLQAAGGALEGTETRFGVGQSGVFAAATTLTSTGAVDSFHSSYTALGGGLAMLNMMLGEVAPGGVGSGLYGMLVLAVVTVFVAGLMVGRTPEYLGKKIGSTQMRLVSLYLLTTPAIVLVGTAAATALPAGRDSMLNSGAHGLSEVLYAYTSAGNNNGSAFAGLSANTPWFNTTLGLAMLLGRFVPMLLVLALAGSLARQRAVPDGAGTLPTSGPLFATMLAGVTVVLVALTYLPALALGPLAEGLS